jgi:hypothetical protein
MTALSPELRCGIVLRVDENACEVVSRGQTGSVRFAPMFPGPRVERVLPGHLVAIASAPGSSDAVVWRWYDAVVLAEETGSVRLWEPAHGEIRATPRRPRQRYRPGGRSYLSRGLPGAEWWIAGTAVDVAEQADVELDEVDRFYAQADLWPTVFSADSVS